MHETITVEDAGGVVTIRLNRPEVLNALNAAMRAELRAALAAAGAQARAVVLTGAGRGFCAGQDLADRAAAGEVDLGRSLREDYAPLLMAVRDCPAPVIAAVNGVAAGAGASLALACDLVIAAEGATFLMAFARIGLVPDSGATWTLPRLVGPARAAGAMLLAEPIPARRAAEWGMIWEAVPDDAFAAHWRARAEALAAGPTAALSRIKAALRATWENGFAAQMGLEAELQAECGRTADFREGVAAFLEKRPARFAGV